MPTFAHDLRYLTAGSELLEQFLLSKDVYWPIGIKAHAGEAPYPQLSLGSLLLSERRCTARARTDRERAELAETSEIILHNQHSWRVAWENKAALEFRARLKQWSLYVDDLRQDPPDNYDRYSYEVFRRVIIELLAVYVRDPSPSDLELQNSLDALVKNLLVNGEFIWEAELEKAFPPSPFWYLYRDIR